MHVSRGGPGHHCGSRCIARHSRGRIALPVMLTEGKADAATDAKGRWAIVGGRGAGYEEGDARCGNAVHDGASR